jgi:hypothetical protein
MIGIPRVRSEFQLLGADERVMCLMDVEFGLDWLSLNSEVGFS